MKKHFTNAAFGVVDYISYPLGMLLVAPIVLRCLGASEYGLWMIATAVVSAGGIIASGFCDANIQRVAHHRGTGAVVLMVHTVRSILGINLVLGGIVGLCVWAAAPYAASRIAASDITQLKECLLALRIASVLIIVRAVETVGVSTHRAFEQYRGTVQISAVMRMLTLGSAAVLALCGRRTNSILVSTGIFLFFGTILQFVQLHKHLGTLNLLPTFHPGETQVLLKFGIFTWFQSLGSVVFGQFDRIVLGISLGTLAVAPYSLCVQFAQPLLGLLASALHFLFPYLSGHAATVSSGEVKKTVLKAVLCNFLLVACGAALLFIFGPSLIRLWAGAEIARNTTVIFPLVVCGSALAGLSVTGTYTMQALGLFRTAAFISIGGRALTLIFMIYLLHRFGLVGLAASRTLYGLATLAVYFPLWQRLGAKQDGRSAAPSQAPLCEAQGGSKL